MKGQFIFGMLCFTSVGLEEFVCVLKQICSVGVNIY